MKIVVYHQLNSMHIGNGSSLGVVDLPIYREAHTDFPTIPSSAIKGVLRADFEPKDLVDTLFGNQDKEGDIIFTDAKIVLFPIKSLKGVFAWITCPMVLKRFQRDTGKSLNLNLELSDDKALVSSNDVVLNKNVILEEFSFESKLDESIKSLKTIFDNVDENRIVILHDDVFRFFVKNYTEIVARISIDQEKGTAKSGALWYQELTPAESVYYGLLMSRTKNKDNLSKVEDFISKIKIFQFGADETLGRGFAKLTLKEA
ncbi:MAG: type III-B CRISPR module RAMP protein Cmr4 [Hydrogenobaculum sp.]|nr:MAG: type III-B CRISPR module RAMP protein Cmr4 [Hydrogenobaculum sp.]HEK25396.1 type III-B CRISPR module RAMP protein Cmr4 [Hydrogenobaculum sp.]